MQAIFDRLVSLLPANLQRYAKALVPLVTAFSAAVVQWGATGTFDLTETLTAVGGVLVALLTYKTPNVGPSVPPPDGDGSVPPAENPDAGVHTPTKPKAKPKPRRKAA